ncbi:polyadp-ribose glycohydrolase [Lasius niger]|uniref:Polyadp-ribose glycohydrolase n=1 Tax=Lasius niger TaxID=67767 RepID=A0A0J7KJQ0_LASNI|nr:polyadp-ribose glycohydrolase [Lasius niger]
MALVMLPCDLPWWPAVVKQLDKAALAKNSEDLIDAMQRLHDMCNISLDPEEDMQDADLFSMLGTFLNKDLEPAEREQVFTKTIPRIVERAKDLKGTKPPQGLHFSLQQQGIAIRHSPRYPENRNHVMTSKQWLTIEDWLESNIPLCPLTIRHEGRLERVETESKVLQVCFANAKIGGGVLDDDLTQETVHVATHPEMLAAILSVEALEDNEVLIIEGVRHMSRINDPRHKAIFESISKPNVVTVCCIDPEDYSRLPLTQFEEDNILREMNKSLLGFRQRHVPSSPTDPIKSDHPDAEVGLGSRRLSPIGESFSSTPPETEGEDKVFAASSNSKIDKQPPRDDKLESTTEVRSRPNGKSMRPPSPHKVCKDASCTNRRNRFIVLGSSGEVLPVTRQLGQMSVYSSCNSQSTDSFHSAKETIDEEPEEEEQKLNKCYSAQLDTPERRGTFAQRLKDALKRESTATGGMTSSNTSSGESSYAVGISVSGSHVGDQDINSKIFVVVLFQWKMQCCRVRRGGSRGFVLRDETVDEEFLKESLEAEQKWLGRFRQSQGPMFQRKDTSASSKYSFSTEYNSGKYPKDIAYFCSELEEVYEQLSKWLEDPIVADESRELDARDQAVVRFAGSLLKRALSESFAGVPLQEGEPQPFIDANDVSQQHKLALALPRENSPQGGDLLPIATGNWGCGTRLKGDPQLKLVIQWLASSLAGAPRLIYYTSGNPSLSKLDTVSRVLMDRRWSVGDLAAATLKYAGQTIEEQAEGRNSLFEEIIGMDKPSP